MKNRLFLIITHFGAYLKQRYIMIILATWMVFLMEFLSRSSVQEALRWTIHHRLELVFNIALIGSLLFLFTAIIGQTQISYWMVFILVLILSLISGVKLKILGVPPLPWDFVLTGETKDMTQYIRNILDWKIIAGVVIYIGTSIGLLCLLPSAVKTIKWKEKALLAVVSAIILAGIFFQPASFMKRAFGIENMVWNQTENVSDNGFLLAAIMNLDYMNSHKLKDYNEDAITTIASQTSYLYDVKDIKPNIIVILSEAFWDPTIIPGIKFSRDPIPNFHELSESYPSGWLLSPQFGGGTANVEYEILTGNSLRFFPQGTIVYNQHMDRPVDSLASITARQGYVPTAISPFHNWFFNSRQAYQNLGFSKFISVEFFKQVFVGSYIADDEVANTIITQSEKTIGSDFIFANTMENHFHYYLGKFEQNTIKVENEMPDAAKEFLETYAQGVQDADKMLKKLTDYYTKIGEPTIILFFGDHLPALGDNYQAYTESGYLEGSEDPKFMEKMYRTPFIVWNNYLPANNDKLYMSPSSLNPYLINQAQLKGTYYTNFLSEFSKKYPVLPPTDHYAEMNIQPSDIKPYELLQYDIMFGKQYAYSSYDIKDNIVNADYVLGLGPITIKEMSLQGSELRLNGENFPNNSLIYVNDIVQETTWIDNEHITANVQNLESGNFTVQVKVKDSKEEVVASSNVYSQ